MTWKLWFSLESETAYSFGDVILLQKNKELINIVCLLYKMLKDYRVKVKTSNPAFHCKLNSWSFIKLSTSKPNCRRPLGMLYDFLFAQL